MPTGSSIGLENRLQYHQIPLPDETVALLDGFTTAEAGYWHDTGHAEVLHRLGFLPHETWFESLGDHLVGAHVHDVRGVLDHRAPGTAQLDWGKVSAGLGSLDAITLEIDQREPDERRCAPPRPSCAPTGSPDPLAVLEVDIERDVQRSRAVRERPC